MAGIIVGYQGYQRSGKTIRAYLDAEKYRQRGCQVYSNMNVPGWNKIYSLCEIPFNYEPKVLVLDEAYSFLDSRNWNNFDDATIFFNTIGKQNILLLFTTVNLGEVEKRVREKINYLYLVKSDENYIYYKVIDVVRRLSKVESLKKCRQLFDTLRYNHLEVPDLIDCSLKNFRQKVKEIQEKERKYERKVLIV